MKTILSIVFLSITGYAADQPAAPKQVPLTELQKTHMDKAVSDAKRLDLEFKIAEYRKQLGDVQREWEAAREQACLGLGVAKDKIQTECQVDADWTDPTGKPTGRVVWVVPVAPAPDSIGKPSPSTAGARQ